MTSQAYAQYYTVGSDEEDGWTPVGHKDKGQPRQSADGGAQEVKGYDVGESRVFLYPFSAPSR